MLASADRPSGTRPPGEGRRGSLTLAPSSSPPSGVESKRTRRRRRVAALLVLLGLGAAIDGAITWRAAKKSIPDWTQCPTAFVTRGAIDGVLPAQGVLTLADTVRIGSPLEGQVVTVIASPGDRVKKGQILARLDDLEQRTELGQARLQAASAELAGIGAEKRLDDAIDAQGREGTLREYLSPDETLPGEAGYAEIELLAAKTQIAKRRLLLGYTRALLDRRVIRSPIAGTVISRSIEAGESIVASPPGPPLFVIGADPRRRLRMAVDIDERYANRVQPGSAIVRLPDLSGSSFEAKVRQVFPAELSPRTPERYQVLVDVENEFGALAAGMAAGVDLPVTSSPHALRVPMSAIRFADPAAGPRSGEGTVWFAESNHSIRPVAVDVGSRDDSFVELEGAGIAAGQAVVANPSLAACSRMLDRSTPRFGD
jgi:HlyD family secretion protein